MGAMTLSLFTKPWPALSLDQLALLVREPGLGAIELPVRPGFQVEPETAAVDLPRAVNSLTALGVRVPSIASSPERGIIDGCAMAGVPLIRVMARILPGERYTTAEARLRAEYAALEPILHDAGVKVGVQNHCGSYVPNALGLRTLLADLDPDCFTAVWDAAHEALVGMPPEFALDVLADRLGMVNLKNALWERSGEPDAQAAHWQPYWCAGRVGLADWRRVIAELRRIKYSGVICLTAEYSDASSVVRLVAEDVAYVRALLDGAQDVPGTEGLA